jgi:superoxide dismutase, Fe-Mn family
MPTYELPDLTYDHGDLVPHISAQVMELHHGKHHQAYVDGANTTLQRLADARLEGSDVDPVVFVALEQALAFHVGGHLLHSLFWQCLSPDGGGQPEGDLAAAIDDSFGSFAGLRREIDACMAGLQGSGWAVLSWEAGAGRLVVQHVRDHQGQVVVGAQPLLVLDGWEHAYYLDHLNDRAAWVDAFFEVVDWDRTADRFEHR